MEIKFRVLGQPCGKGRPRFAKGHVYTPKKTREYETDIKTAYISMSKGYSYKDTPVIVCIEARLKRAKSNKRKYAVTKPDLDNIIKAVLDGLNGVAFDDDRQVIEISAKKLYCNAENDMPYTEVVIYPKQ